MNFWRLFSIFGQFVCVLLFNFALFLFIYFRCVSIFNVRRFYSLQLFCLYYQFCFFDFSLACKIIMSHLYVEADYFCNFNHFVDFCSLVWNALFVQLLFFLRFVADFLGLNSNFSFAQKTRFSVEVYFFSKKNYIFCITR